MRKIAGFDIEIAKDLPEGENWRDHIPLGITCAAVHTEDGIDLEFYAGMAGDGYTDRMSEREIELMVNVLFGLISEGYDLYTWNGLGFDFAVIANEINDPTMRQGIIRLATEYHVDMAFHFLCGKGYMIGLNAASKGLGLSGKLEGMNGALAPIVWRGDDLVLGMMGRDDLASMSLDEKRQLTREYVLQDAVSTTQVALAALNKHGIPWVAKSGRYNKWYMKEWLTVKDALLLPEPDISWMTNPMRRESFMEWMEEMK